MATFLSVQLSVPIHTRCLLKEICKFSFLVMNITKHLISITQIPCLGILEQHLLSSSIYGIPGICQMSNGICQVCQMHLFHRSISDTQAEAIAAVHCILIKQSAKDDYPSHLKEEKQAKRHLLS